MPAERVTMPDGVRLSVDVRGPVGAPVIVLLHGFPELGFSWRHQVGALQEAGFRLLVPDLRGFGASDVPEDVTAYSTASLTADVIALLDYAGVESGIVIGHDWGADVAWKTAWWHPDRIRAVAGLSVPFTPRPPAPPLGLMRRRFGEHFYMVWFQQPGVAERALGADIPRTLTTTRIWGPDWAADATEPRRRPSYMSEEELAVYVEAFTRTGFRGGLSYYRNIDRNWEQTAHLQQRQISAPALFLTGERDPVRAFMPAAAMAAWVTDLRRSIVVPGAGHWVNQEAPEAVNEALRDWLGALA